MSYIMVGIMISVFLILISAIVFLLIKLKRSLVNKSQIYLQLSDNENIINSLQSENNKLVEENQSLDLLARLVRQSPNAIMLMDKEGNVLYTNQGFTNMYEYTYKEFISARGSNYRKTSFSLAVNERIERINSTKQPVKYEALNITKTGKELWTQTALMPILDDNGYVDGMVTIDTDIHQRIASSDSLICRMEGINNKVDNMSKQFKVLTTETQSLFARISESNQLIEQTDQIVKFIKEISDKTKILGINASIEANIAGQHGRGFRVVANEIVDISNKTIQSVSQISNLISSVHTKQEQLTKEKADSELAITNHQQLLKALKSEIREIEHAIAELKQLS